MKRTSMAFMVIAATAIVVSLFASEATTIAQRTNPQLKLADRVEANIASMIGGAYEQGWRKATITRVFEPKNDGSGRRDPLIVALADAVTSRGADDKIFASRIRGVLPYTKAEDLAVKRVVAARTLPSGHVLLKGITVIVTDKRYVLYTRTLYGSIYTRALATIVDETGEIVGGQYDWDEPRRDSDTNWGLTVEGARSQAATDRVYWAHKLILDKLKAVGLWQDKISYLVKTEDGEEYVLGMGEVRRQ